MIRARAALPATTSSERHTGSLANIVAGKSGVREFIQNDLQSKSIDEIERLLTDQSYANAMRRDMDVVHDMLRAAGGSQKAAQLALETTG